MALGNIFRTLPQGVTLGAQLGFQAQQLDLQRQMQERQDRLAEKTGLLQWHQNMMEVSKAPPWMRPLLIDQLFADYPSVTGRQPDPDTMGLWKKAAASHEDEYNQAMSDIGEVMKGN